MSGTRVAETILASVHMRARQQAGHMDASDLIKSMQRQPCKEGAVHIWGPDVDRRAKLLMYQAMVGAILGTDSLPMIFAGDLELSNGESTPCEPAFVFCRLCLVG